jgi:hypothetical protein
VRFRSAERGQTHRCQPCLKRAQVAASKRQIAQEVARTELVARWNVCQQIGRMINELEHVGSDLLELIRQAGDLSP